MIFTSARIDDATFVAANLGCGRLVIVNYTAPQLLWDFRVDGSPSRFKFSGDGALLFVGFWDTHTIAVCDWRQRTVKMVPCPKEVYQICVDHQGRYLVAKGDRRTEIIDTWSGERTKLLYAEAVASGCYLQDQEQIWLPSRKRGNIIKISFDPLDIEYAPTEERAIHCITLSNDQKSYLTCSDPSVVHLRRVDTSEIIWRRRLPEETAAPEAMFSKSSDLIALPSPAGQCTFVLNALTGEEKLRIKPLVFEPLDSTKFFLSNRSICDITTGETELGMSKVKWWRDIGA